MALFRYAAFLALVLSLPIALNLARDARAVPTVWSGPTITFTKTGSDLTDPSDPLNQDRLTGNVWLTRAGDQGMFNIAPGHETNYVKYTSPDDTQWATSVMPANTGKTITASNWAQLSFTDWAPSYGGPGSTLGANITNHNAVVHLLTDDIYLDLSFSYFVSGGDFIYTRSTPAAAAPTGDYNHNNAVDAGDYVVWRRTFGDSASPNGSGADGNSNGTIEQGDYTYWRERYGNAPAGLGAGLASIPEPTMIPLALQLMAVVLCLFRWRSSATLRYAMINSPTATRSPRINGRRLATTLVIFTLLAGAIPSANAAFHLWHVKEVFTNASGSVQFVEMFDSYGGENYVADMTLRAESDGVIKDFTFPDVVDTDVDSTERHILIATSGFGALPGGVVPDFRFDQGGVTGQFFNPNAANITITFLGSGDAISFTGDSLPKDGINSLTDTNASGLPFLSTPNLISDVNSPTNFHNGTGSVNLSNPSPTGDYNGNHLVDAADYAIWRKTLNTGVSPNGSGADGDSNGTIGLGDYTYWRTRFGNTAGAGTLGVGTVPEPALSTFPLSGLLLLLWRRRLSRSIS